MSALRCLLCIRYRKCCAVVFLVCLCKVQRHAVRISGDYNVSKCGLDSAMVKAAPQLVIAVLNMK